MSLRNGWNTSATGVFRIIGMMLVVGALGGGSLWAQVPKDVIYPEWSPGTAIDPATGMAVSTRMRVPSRPQSRTFERADEFIRVGSANITVGVVYGDEDNEGFYDEDYGAARRAAFRHALEIWEGLLAGTVAEGQRETTIYVYATFDPIGDYYLGAGGPYGYYTAPTDSGLSDVLYPAPLYRYLTGFDTNYWFGYDIVIEFTSDLDPSCDCAEVTCDDIHCWAGKWYYGTDENPPANDYDFVTVAVHELCHGLGFIDSFNSDGSYGYGYWGYWGRTATPVIFDLFLVNGGGQRLLELQRSRNNVTGNNVYWDGTNGVRAWQDDFGQTGNVKLYAPTPYRYGSSIAHLDLDTVAGTEFALMAPELAPGFALHTPDSVVLGMLQDMGWSKDRPPDPGDEPEPGDSIDDHPDMPPSGTNMGAPDPIAVRFGTLFEAEGDTDSFYFAADLGSEYNVKLTPNTPFDNAMMTLYATDGLTVLATADAAEDETLEIDFEVTEAGDYFVVVGSNGTAPFQSTFSYELRVTRTKETPQTTQYAIASARADPTRGTAPLTVLFYGGASSGPNVAAVVSEDWDFGDGMGSGVRAVPHTYSQPGTYTGTFTIQDELGGTSRATVIIQVSQVANQAPTATILADRTSGEAPLTVQFTGQGTDPDGTIVRYDWDFGDGGFAGGQQVEHTFTLVGIYNVSLTVTDDRGATATAWLRVQVGTAAAQSFAVQGQEESPPAQAVPSTGAAPCGAITGLTFGSMLLGLWGISLIRRRIA